MSRISLVLYIAVILVASYFVPKNGPFEQSSQLLSITSFFFGIFVAFAISAANTRFNKVIENLKKEESSLVYCYQLSTTFGTRVQNEMREHIDQYLTATVDYRLLDYSESAPQLEELLKYTFSLRPKNVAQNIGFEKMVDRLEDMTINRKQTEVMISQPLSRVEWASVLLLLAIIIVVTLASFFETPQLAALSVAVVVSAVILVETLRSIDGLTWNNKNYIWKSLISTYQAVGLEPYFPTKKIFVQCVNTLVIASPYVRVASHETGKLKVSRVKVA
jgi:ABC-type multidrug transport system fused ATPase/permease subunit